MRAILTAAALALAAALPLTARANDLTSVLDADRAFNEMAQRTGPGPAFAAFAEPTVQMLNLPAPDVARDDLEKLFPPGYHLVWEPKDGAVSADGTLGYTWGDSIIRSTAPDGKVTERPGRYVSIWRRQGDGAWKWIADGDLALPPPPPKPPAPAAN